MVTQLTKVFKVGPSFDFYARTTVQWTTFGGTNGDGYGHDGYSPDLIIPFSSQGIIFILETANSVVEISFNGTTVHARLDSTIANGIAQRLDFNNRVDSLIWYRAVSGANPIVQCLSWGIR